jgi:hypothetical protein
MRRPIEISLATVLAGFAAAAAVAAGSAAHQGARAHAAGLPAPHRKPPDMIFHHGQTQLPLRIIAFATSSFPNAAKLAEFPTAMVHSKWLAHVEDGFGVPKHPAAIAHGFVVKTMPVFPKHDASTSKLLDAWVEREFRLRGIRTNLPSFQTIVIIFQRCVPPQSLDGSGCNGHHPAFLGAGHGPIDSYALSLTPQTGSLKTRLQHSSLVAAHEVAEAISDTHGGWFLHNQDPNHPWAFPPPVPNSHDPQGGLLAATGADSPFVQEDGSNNTEAADLMGGSRFIQAFTPPHGAPIPFAYDRPETNFANDHRDDPGVPPTPQAYYNVTINSDWYVLPVGGSKSVTVTGWTNSNNPHLSWDVVANVQAWEGSHKTQSNFRSPDSCHVSGATHHLTNGAHFTLSVSAVAGQAKRDRWCVVQLKSMLDPISTTGDMYHHWYVGFIER